LAAVAALISIVPLNDARTAEPKPVRLAVVNTPQFSGLMDELIKDFAAKSGIHVTMYSGKDVYERARAGEADIVISHYGKKGAERFVLDGYGTWPRMVFSNQAVIAGPKSDPAKIGGLTSASEALRRIAAARAPFVANALPSMSYIFDLIWEEAGRPSKDGWVIATGESKGRAMKLAEEKQAYVMWGAFPFLRFKQKHDTGLNILVSADPVLQRVMAAVVVKPDKVKGVNVEGAEAFVTYLLAPATQAKIAAFRSPGSDLQLWWPAARDNSVDHLDD
jgi:tungstate transport system substrate-binding protein